MTANVQIKLGGQAWSFWERLTLNRSIDSFSTVTFSGPFDASRREMRAAFRPFAFQSMDVSVDGSDLLTGTMLTPMPRGEPDALTVEASGYAVPAVIMDTNIPVSRFPIEWSGLTLAQIANQIGDAYGFGVQVQGTVGAAFTRVKLAADESPGSFLAELARQRGLIMRDTPDGQLLFTTSAQTGRPVARLEEGQAPVMEVAVTFSPQDYYSEITATRGNRPGRRGAKVTQLNPFLRGIVRPFTFAAQDIEKGDLPGAVAAKLGRMFGNMVGYVVKVPTWYDESGNLWDPDTTVSLKAPSAMVYDEYEFLIRDVIYEQDGSGELASLGLVLPGAFSGQAPASLPWD